ncbi:putative C-S lyase [Campylobacter blaseri]|uniref:cysteine-S-conjugate beta-lyase n=1 Tax=Campylobacter blaseri TaxID=2042961 RepID=A0A2P8R1H4_9BACT|nr:MalY/PatB family protein [Campylobacter blaseri]PSM52356.1 aminotransferase [Campylobacter blaseri]PSM54122.1 aminotransferase [Campylobacter blaseri]QKF85566.1 putative C-S lyase [Campylobacter blaseri]
MKYDFKNYIDKTNTGSFKWNLMRLKGKNIEKGIIPFSVADMEFKIAPQIIKSLKDTLDKPHLGYTKPDEKYFKSIIKWFKKRHEFQIKKEWILISPGIVIALFSAVRAYTKKGDGVIIMTPVYPPFYNSISMNERKIIENKLIFKNNRYEIDFKDLEEKAKDKNNKMLILCSPHNPVGRVWSKEELIKIGKICLQNGIVVVSDEIHCDLIMKDYKHTVFSSISKEFADISVTCTAPSKSFNIAGLQASNLIIKNKKLREKFSNELKKQGLTGLNSFAYIATKTAYNKCEDWLNDAIEIIGKNEKKVHRFFKKYIPQISACKLEGTYLMWINLRNLNLSEEEIENILINKAQIFANKGLMFGKNGEGFIRLNIACPTRDLKKALRRLKTALENII